MFSLTLYIWTVLEEALLYQKYSRTRKLMMYLVFLIKKHQIMCPTIYKDSSTAAVTVGHDGEKNRDSGLSQGN